LPAQNTTSSDAPVRNAADPPRCPPEEPIISASRSYGLPATRPRARNAGITGGSSTDPPPGLGQRSVRDRAPVLAHEAMRVHGRAPQPPPRPRSIDVPRCLRSAHPDERPTRHGRPLPLRTMRSADRVASASARGGASLGVCWCPWSRAGVPGPRELEQAGKPVRSPEEGAMSAHQLLDAARPTSVSGDDARSSRRPDPAEQGPPVPGGPARDRRDRCGHAPGRRRPPRPADAR
jgi:hypothetical protein